MLRRLSPKLLFKIALVLLIPPALLINLGLLPFLADEPTRATVALEMFLNQEFLSPTLGGELYLNKPPLFNWLLLGLTQLGGFNEFAIRLITILSLVLFFAIIYFSFKPYLKNGESLLVALLSLATGRICLVPSFFFKLL
jgi:4-amino-4-deoxy-L-arabinose transferase-like glycosyltransferase